MFIISDGLTRDVARAWAGKENDQCIACHTVSAMPNFWDLCT